MGGEDGGLPGPGQWRKEDGGLGARGVRSKGVQRARDVEEGRRRAGGDSGLTGMSRQISGDVLEGGFWYEWETKSLGAKDTPIIGRRAVVGIVLMLSSAWAGAGGAGTGGCLTASMGGRLRR